MAKKTSTYLMTRGRNPFPALTNVQKLVRKAEAEKGLVPIGHYLVENGTVTEKHYKAALVVGATHYDHSNGRFAIVEAKATKKSSVPEPQRV